MWSGPRTLSTALMRSFENRTDTNVIDEPLYAYYLNCNNINHPMKENIINHYCTNYKKIINQITKNVSPKIFYIKHMAHHIPQNYNLKWISKGKNSLLIREPKKVLSSYIKPQNTNILDYGFGSGQNIIHLTKLGWTSESIAEELNIKHATVKTIKFRYFCFC